VSSRADVEALPAAERPTQLAADAAELAKVLDVFATEALAP